MTYGRIEGFARMPQKALISSFKPKLLDMSFLTLLVTTLFN